MATKKKIDKLKKYVWGFGLEHEMHIFHKPDYLTPNIESFILFDGKSAVIRVAEQASEGKIKLKGSELEDLLEVPFEATGRRCNKKWVIKKVPFNMPEFITDHPINYIDSKRDIQNMCEELIYRKQNFLNILAKDKTTKEQIKKYGQLVEYPFGMTSYLKYPENPNSKVYRFKKTKKTGKDSVRQEYVGSYHITVSLPHIKHKTTKKDFIEKHINFSNQLQWLEPLLLTAFFSCDQKAPGSNYKRVRGSFRVMNIGWGNFAGSDVRKLGEGIGRYTNIKTYWREKSDFYQLEKLKPCFKPSPSAIREKGTTTLSSDFRTFGSNDPDRPDHRESGAGMTVGNGVEFRIFDQFNDYLLKDLCKFISYVAENSRVHKSTKYVYKNKNWISNLDKIMKDGWCAKISKGYIDDLRKVLGLKIKTESRIAKDVLDCINDELFNKHKNGDYVIIMNYANWFYMNKYKNKKSAKFSDDDFKAKMPNINFESWVMGFFMKLNRNNNLFKNFYKFINEIPNKITYSNFKKLFFKFYSKKYWEKDVFNVAYLLKYLNYFILKNKKDGSIKELIKNRITTEKNFNEEIIAFFGKNKDKSQDISISKLQSNLQNIFL